MKKYNFILIAVLVLSMLFVGCQSTNVENESSKASEIITQEMALIASTGSQKLKSEEVIFTSVALNTENDANEYEVEFLYNGYKYLVDIDAITGEVNKVSKEKYIPEQQNDIGKDAAIKAALEKAGLSDVDASQLDKLIVKLDRERGMLEYEIEFIYQGIEYEVDVSAVDGTILDFGKEAAETDDYFADDDRYDDDDYDDDDRYDDDHDDDKAVNNIPGDVIGDEEAIAIALSHARLTKAGIMGLRVTLERDDGKLIYEVEFYFVDTEYDYDIDAITGEILSYDRDAEHISIGEASKPDSNELISESEAKSIALTHANLSEKDIYDFDIELDFDKGVMKYEIEFKSGNYEYEYDIDAVNGKILQFDKEYDD